MVPMWTVVALAASAVAGTGSDERDAVVVVWQGARMCAGVHLAPGGTVATSYHCVIGGRAVRVETREGHEHRGRVTASDPASDLAIISVDLGATPTLEVAEDEPTSARTCGSVSNRTSAPAGFIEGTLRWSVAAGVVSNVGTTALQLDAPVNPGNSGGPVLNDAGAVVGIVSRRLSGRGLSFATRASALASLREEASPMPALGGSWAAELTVGGLAASSGVPAVGVRPELAIRDRAWLALTLHLPVGSRWQALQRGEVAALRADARIGLRQRVGYGSSTVFVDAWGGIGAREVVAAPEGVASLGRTLAPAALAGGTLRVRGVALEAAAVGHDGGIELWVAMTLRVPGVLGVF